MKYQYLEKTFRQDALTLIMVMDSIIEDFTSQGYVLTVRQLYYQLVGKAMIPNTEQSYKRITALVNDAKLAGLLDWDALEDRTRIFKRRSRWEDRAEILASVANSFHKDLWRDQSTRVFILVEKDALTGVLGSVCFKYDVPLLACKGYPSGTVLREFVERDILPTLAGMQDVLILHCGDHDPSGLDMTRDLTERIALFTEGAFLGKWGLKRVALNMDQIQRHAPPPNPAKATDTRFEDYRKQFGSESWELDALSPSTLTGLVEAEIDSVIDVNKWADTKNEIAADRKQLQTLVDMEKITEDGLPVPWIKHRERSRALASKAQHLSRCDDRYNLSLEHGSVSEVGQRYAQRRAAIQWLIDFGWDEGANLTK